MIRHDLLREGVLVLFWLGIWEVFSYIIYSLHLNRHQRVLVYAFVTIGASIGYIYSWKTPDTPTSEYIP